MGTAERDVGLKPTAVRGAVTGGRAAAAGPPVNGPRTAVGFRLTSRSAVPTATFLSAVEVNHLID